MRKLTTFLLGWHLSLLIILACAESAAVSNQQKDVVELVTGLPKPPFIMEQQNSGLQLDIIREALALTNKSVKFTGMPLGRNITGYQRINADGVITLPHDYEHPAMYLSKPYIVYQNVAVSLAENSFNISEIKDLSGKNLVAFQNARKFLGEEYGNTIAYLMDYREVYDQQKQIEMLFLRRAEVIVLDINIFKYFVKHNQGPIYKKPFKIHYIFPERPYSIGFRSKALRDEFDHNIESLKASGSYQHIEDNYLNE